MIKKRTVTGVKQALYVLALALSTQVVQAAPLWQINPEGTGQSGASTVSTVNAGGVGFVQILPNVNNASTFTFVEHGAYQVLQSDGVTPFGTKDLTVAYSISGIGSFIGAFALQFTSGTIDMYADPVFNFATSATNYGVDDGTHLATFNVFDGGLNASGLVTVKANAVANSLLPGYLFAADGSDLAAHNNVLLELGVFNKQATPDDLLVSGVVCGLAAYTGPGCNGTPFSNSPMAFTVSDGGFATITSVPEPTTISLLLAGLGLIAFSAKRRKSSSH
jgi:hypothetical protein